MHCTLHRAARLLLGLALIGLAPTPDANAGDPRPNILLIMADDMGYSDAGCYGGEIATPNLDSLAEGGLRFAQFYSTGRCWPSRAAALTGYYAQQVRRDVFDEERIGARPGWAPLLPVFLRDAGYRNYHSGKWHIDGEPLDNGFDRSYLVQDQDRFFSPTKHFLDGEAQPQPAPDSGYYATIAIADHAVGVLREHARDHAGAPFFHYLAFTAPHFPLHALQEDIDRYRTRYLEGWDAIRRARWDRQREMKLLDAPLSALDPGIIPGYNLSEADLASRIGAGETGRAIAWDTLSEAQKRFQAEKMAIHAAMIDRMDREIGRVLDQIKSMDAFENTLILFVSDNGASAEQIIRGDEHDPAAPPGSAASYLCLGPGFSSAANTPFRLHKSWTHEGGIASPLIVHWPRGLQARGEIRQQAGHFIDILPTVLDLTGAPRPEIAGAPALPGRSLVPSITADNSVERPYLWWRHVGHSALRQGDWKIVRRNEESAWSLYNLRTDRAEMIDLAAEEPEIAARLEGLWEEAAATFRKEAGIP